MPTKAVKILFQTKGKKKKNNFTNIFKILDNSIMSHKRDIVMLNSKVNMKSDNLCTNITLYIWYLNNIRILEWNLRMHYSLFVFHIGISMNKQGRIPHTVQKPCKYLRTNPNIYFQPTVEEYSRNTDLVCNVHPIKPKIIGVRKISKKIRKSITKILTLKYLVMVINFHLLHVVNKTIQIPLMRIYSHLKEFTKIFR